MRTVPPAHYSQKLHRKTPLHVSVFVFPLRTYYTMQMSQFDCRSTAHIRRNSFDIIGGNIFSLSFSKQAKYFAIGNDEGQIEVYFFILCILAVYLRLVKLRRAGGNWERMRIYDANSQIRAMQWDPTTENRLYVGTQNGNIYRIEVNPDGENMSYIFPGHKWLTCLDRISSAMIKSQDMSTQSIFVKMDRMAPFLLLLMGSISVSCTTRSLVSSVAS